MKKRITIIACLALVAVSLFAAWKDGVFSVKETKADERGYVAEIKLTVKAGLIAKIDYNEANKGNSKWADKAYNASMKKMAGVSWVEAVQALEADLLKKQAPDKVDAISGATELSTRFKELAAAALAKAK